MTNIVLWLILSLEVIGGLVVAWIAGENKQLVALARQATERSRRAGLWVLALGVVNSGLWLTYSIGVDDWRFAGVASVPVFVQVVRQIVGRGFTAKPTPELAGEINEKVTIQGKPFRLIRIDDGIGQGTSVLLQDEPTLAAKSRWIS